MTLHMVLSGLAVGTLFGFVLARGRFCINTALRNAVYVGDFTSLRSYVFALVTALVGANILGLLGLVHLEPLRQEVAPAANALGGMIFGIGMVLAGGDCGTSWSRAGEGLVGPWMTALGIMVGAAAADRGILADAASSLRGAMFLASGGADLPQAVGVNPGVVIAVVSAAGLFFCLRGRNRYTSDRAGYPWPVTGFLVGGLCLLGLYLSEYTTGTAASLTFSAPSGDLLSSVVSARPWTWSAAMITGVPAGALLSAWSKHEFSWRAPRAEVLSQQLAGGLLMGSGGALAGGCSIGHGITGLAVLSLASIVTMTGMIAGSLAMIYLLFMRKGSREQDG